jgi:hypothetical protein
MRCEPERKSYQNWHTLSLEQSSSSGSGSGSSSSGGGPCGFCLFSRETMAAKGKGKKRRRTAYMVSARRQPVPPPPSYPLLQAGPQLHENAPSRAHARAAQTARRVSPARRVSVCHVACATPRSCSSSPSTHPCAVSSPSCEKTPFENEFSVCLSRACLGKIILFRITARERPVSYLRKAPSDGSINCDFKRSAPETLPEHCCCCVGRAAPRDCPAGG